MSKLVPQEGDVWIDEGGSLLHVSKVHDSRACIWWFDDNQLSAEDVSFSYFGDCRLTARNNKPYHEPLEDNRYYKFKFFSKHNDNDNNITHILYHDKGVLHSHISFKRLSFEEVIIIGEVALND